MSDAEALHRAVSELVRVYQFRDRDRICCYDISVTQCYALEALATDGPQRLGALAERMRLDKSTMSRVVQTLVRKGYAEQGTDKRDARAVAIAITRSGRKLYDKIEAELIEQQEAVLRGMDPSVRGDVAEVIRRLAKAAEARFVSGTSVGCADGACVC
jgi:MarR family transcriptional regulator, 2-MHQ and catechol-resistance regulon repressor